MNSRFAILIVVGCAAVVLIQIGYWIGIAVFVDKPDGAGTFGDMFGGLNTFFTGLAFLGVIYTIYTQVTDAAQARRDQSESLRLVQAEVALLREDVELQRRRDRIEAGPFFDLVSSSLSAQTLDFRVKNVGAPVIVRGFNIVTPGCAVRSWSPSILPTNAEFRAPCSIPTPHPQDYQFRIGVRDRWGDHRLYELRLTTEPVGRLDFRELPVDQRYTLDV